MSNNIPDNYDQNQIPPNYDQQEVPVLQSGEIVGNPYAYQPPSETTINRENAQKVADSEKWYNRRILWTGIAFISGMTLGLRYGGAEAFDWLSASKEEKAPVVSTQTVSSDPLDDLTENERNDVYLGALKKVAPHINYAGTDEELIEAGRYACIALNISTVEDVVVEFALAIGDELVAGSIISASSSVLCREHKVAVDKFFLSNPN